VSLEASILPGMDRRHAMNTQPTAPLETLEQRMARDLAAWRLAQAAIAKARGG
jgi:hypothetical protein